jgi:GT2 family glycosyltransferase
LEAAIQQTYFPAGYRKEFKGIRWTVIPPFKIAFVVVNYRCAPSTIDFVQSIRLLARDEETKLQVVVVDNSGEHGDYEHLKAHFGEIHDDFIAIDVVRSPNNLGYFEGLNVGLDLVAKMRPDFVMVGNPDLVLDHHFLKNLRDAKYSPDCFVISPAIVTTDGQAQNPQYRNELGFLHRFVLRAYFHSYPLARAILKLKKWAGVRSASRIQASADMVPIFMGHGSCYVLTQAYFANLRRLPRRVFLFGEEALLSEVVFLYGGRIFYDPNLRVVHAEHTTTGQMPAKSAYKIAQASYRIYRRYLYRS